MWTADAVSILMTIAGAIAGPGYYFYCDSFSGKNVGTYHTNERPGLDLDPQMNPVSIGVTMGSSGHGGENFIASLDLGTRRVAARSASMSSDATVLSFTLDQINIQQPGTYHFTIERALWPGVKLLGIKYNVRRNTKVANLIIVWTGAVVLLLGLLLNASEGRRREERER
jgi:hypothetical protein